MKPKIVAAPPYEGKLTIIRSKAPTKADWMLDAITCFHILKPYNANNTGRNAAVILYHFR